MDKQPKKRRSFTLKDMLEHAESKGGKCLAKEYKNSTYRLLFECSCGHKWRATPLEIMGKKSQPGAWCPKCT